MLAALLLAPTLSMAVGCAALDIRPDGEPISPSSQARQISECVFVVEFARDAVRIDWSAARVLDRAVRLIETSGPATINAYVTQEEDRSLRARRIDAAVEFLVSRGVPRASIQIGGEGVAATGSAARARGRAYIRACPWGVSPGRVRRVTPRDPDERVEYRFRGTSLRVPMRFLDELVWNDVPMEPVSWLPVLQIGLPASGDEESDLARACRSGDQPACSRQARISFSSDIARSAAFVSSVRPPGSPAPNTSEFRFESQYVRQSFGWKQSFRIVRDYEYFGRGECLWRPASERFQLPQLAHQRGAASAYCTVRDVPISPLVQMTIQVTVDVFSDLAVDLVAILALVERFRD